MNKQENEIIADFANSLKPKLICGYQGACMNEGKRRRQNTHYVDDELNYVISCDSCFEEIENDWENMWADYYSGCL